MYPPINDPAAFGVNGFAQGADDEDDEWVTLITLVISIDRETSRVLAFIIIIMFRSNWDFIFLENSHGLTYSGDLV